MRGSSPDMNPGDFPNSPRKFTSTMPRYITKKTISDIVADSTFTYHARPLKSFKYAFQHHLRGFLFMTTVVYFIIYFDICWQR